MVASLQARAGYITGYGGSTVPFYQRFFDGGDTFRVLAADRRVVPVVRRFLADGETPIGLYRKLSGDRPGTFLLESAEAGVWARWSIVGAASAATPTSSCRRAPAAAFRNDVPRNRRSARVTHYSAR